MPNHDRLMPNRDRLMPNRDRFRCQIVIDSDAILQLGRLRFKCQFLPYFSNTKVHNAEYISQRENLIPEIKKEFMFSY